MNIRIGGFLAIALGLLFVSTWRQDDLFAIGCDPFGYARQAELFRDHGLVKGIDTRIEAPEAQFLINIAQTITPDSRQWSLAIAPHCHSYKAAVGHVILEYPPGAGFILSMFPENVSMGLAFVIGLSLVFSVFAAGVVARQPSLLGLLAALASLVLTEDMMARLRTTRLDAVNSASVPLSLALIPLCAWLAGAAFPPAGQPARWGQALGFGLVAGLLFATRLPNIFLLAGLVGMIGVNQTLWRPKAIRRAFGALSAAFAGVALTGLAPVLAANWVNAGSPFATTYSPIDAAPPVLSLPYILDALRYYMTRDFAAPAVSAALGALVLSGFVLWRRPQTRQSFGAWLGALICYLLTLGFFCTHAVRTPYYLLPASIMTLCLLLFQMALPVATDKAYRPSRLQLAACLAPFLIFAVLRCAAVTPRVHPAALPAEVRAPQAIVWADLSSGTALYYQNKYAAKINFGGACLRDQLVRAVLQQGRPQYFIEDSEVMSAIIRHLSGSISIEQMGVFDTWKKFPIWKIDTTARWQGKPCAG